MFCPLEGHAGGGGGGGGGEILEISFSRKY